MRSRPPAEVRPEGRVRDAFSCPGKVSEDSTVGKKQKQKQELSCLPPILWECQTLPDGLKCKPLDQSQEGPCAPSLIRCWAGPFLSSEPHLLAPCLPSPGQVRLPAASLSAVPTRGIPCHLYLSDPTDQPQAEKPRRMGDVERRPPSPGTWTKS